MTNILYTGKRQLTKLIDEVVEAIEKDGLPKNSKAQMNTSIISNNSNIAVGNTGNTIQNLSIDISGFNSYYDSAIKEIDETDKLLKDEKEELKELLSDIKIDLDNKTEPKKSLLRSIGKYSEKIISIGGSLTGIYQVIQPLIN